MTNKPKKQGTTFESSLVKKLHERGFYDAKRIAEGGSKDIGDIELSVEGNDFVIECKARQTLNVTRELAKAKEKANKDLPFGVSKFVVLAWKRLVKSQGSNRIPDGERLVYVVDHDTMMWLLQGGITSEKNKTTKKT